MEVYLLAIGLILAGLLPYVLAFLAGALSGVFVFVVLQLLRRGFKA